MSVKDPVAAPEPRSGAVRPMRRDAVGAEIPVTVHASRTTQGLGKNLPAVHEDTRTVIVLQQGAVVRLTANLMTGETVVLTNRMTGADILCRVGKIKSQPGIQHYVDLEFMQRAPNFWGDALAAVSAPMPETRASVAAPPATSTPVVAPVAVLPSPVATPVPVEATAPQATPVMAEPLLLTRAAVTPPAPVTVMPPPQAPAMTAAAPSSAPPAAVVELPVAAAAAETLQPAPLAEPIAPPWKASRAGTMKPMSGGLNEPRFGAIDDNRSASAPASRKSLMVAAAVVLLLGVAAGGYWFYSHQSASAGSSAVESAANVVPALVTPDLTATTAPADPALTSSAPRSEPEMDVVVESRASVDSSVARNQPPSSSSTRTSAPATRRNVPIAQLKAPRARTTTARFDTTNAPPAMVGTVGLGDTGVANALLAAEPAGPAPPPAVGGRLVQPQLISSTAAVYPAAARMQRIQGTVVLDALVDETGKVVETKAITGPQPLVVAAQDAVQNWKYKPAQLNGKPIAVHTKVSVRFNLR